DAGVLRCTAAVAFALRGLVPARLRVRPARAVAGRLPADARPADAGEDPGRHERAHERVPAAPVRDAAVLGLRFPRLDLRRRARGARSPGPAGPRRFPGEPGPLGRA